MKFRTVYNYGYTLVWAQCRTCHATCCLHIGVGTVQNMPCYVLSTHWCGHSAEHAMLRVVYTLVWAQCRTCHATCCLHIGVGTVQNMPCHVLSTHWCGHSAEHAMLRVVTSAVKR